MRPEVEEVEVWEMPKSNVRKGWYTVSSYKNDYYKHFLIIVSGTNGSQFELQGYWIACGIIANARYADKMGAEAEGKLNFEPCYEYHCSFDKVRFLPFI